MLLLFLLSCTADKGLWDDSSDYQKLDTGFDTTTTSTDDTGLTGAAWWTISGEILIENGFPVNEDSILNVAILDIDLNLLCETPTTTLVISETKSPDDLVYSFWSITPQFYDCGTLQNYLPYSLFLGFGEMHPDLAAVATEGDLSESINYLYGAYLRLSGEDTWAFGVAYTYANLYENAIPANSAPMPNGTYIFNSLYTLPLTNP